MYCTIELPYVYYIFFVNERENTAKQEIYQLSVMSLRSLGYSKVASLHFRSTNDPPPPRFQCEISSDNIKRQFRILFSPRPYLELLLHFIHHIVKYIYV